MSLEIERRTEVAIPKIREYMRETWAVVKRDLRREKEQRYTNTKRERYYDCLP